MNVVKTVNPKSTHTTEKKIFYFFNAGSVWENSSLNLLWSSFHHVFKSNHYAVHLKRCCMLIVSPKPERKFEKVYYQLCFLKDGRRLLCLFLNRTPLKACKRKVITLILSEEKQVNWGQREGDLHCRLGYSDKDKSQSYMMIHLKVNVFVTQSCPTACDPMNCSLPGSSVHGIL